jgi:NADPH:quinone reductase-like Zn-dependent oxidoreductase
MTTTSWVRGSASVVVLVAAAAIGILLSLPVAPDLEWETVVVPAAQKYAETFRPPVEDTQPQGQRHEQPLRGMYIAVTGATSGIGLGLTRKLSLLGATVVAIGRSPEKLKQLQEELLRMGSGSISNVETVLADFSDLDSVAQASQYMLEHYDHIDVLVNNAGIHTGFQGLVQTWASPQGYDLPFTGTWLCGVGDFDFDTLHGSIFPLVLLTLLWFYTFYR